MGQARPATKPAIPAGPAFLRVLHSSPYPNHSLDQPLWEIRLLDIAQSKLRTEHGGTDKGLAAGHYNNGPARIKVAVMKPLSSFFYSIAHSLQFPESHQASAHFGQAFCTLYGCLNASGSNGGIGLHRVIAPARLSQEVDCDSLNVAKVAAQLHEPRKSPNIGPGEDTGRADPNSCFSKGHNSIQCRFGRAATSAGKRPDTIVH